MRHGADRIGARARDAAGAQGRVVVGQIAFVGTAMRRGEREVLMPSPAKRSAFVDKGRGN